ncbi:unnamed protein product [Heterobilharzia americana]|nr:unnamed protein product [Heterobilharzia americana]
MLNIFVRRLSTSSPALKLVHPPIQVSGIEGRYATALYSAASKKNALDNIEKDLQLIKSTLDKDLKVNEVTKNLFAVLAENGRLSKMSIVIDKFGQMMAAHRGEVSCTWILKPGEKLQLTLEHDPSLIGGVVVNIGDRLVDYLLLEKFVCFVNSLNNQFRFFV